MKARLFGNNIATPSQAFVDEFSKLTGVYLMHSDSKFYDHLQSALTQKYMINPIKVDDHFNREDSDYDNDKCTYKDQTDVSMKKYMELKFGEKSVKMMHYLLDANFNEEFPDL